MHSPTYSHSSKQCPPLFPSLCPTDMCQPWPHQPAFRQWSSIIPCPRRCLPSRSHPLMPAMPCPCLLLSTTPTLWRTTSLCCAATRCRSTTPSTRSPTGSSGVPIWTTAGAACPPAPTGWQRRKTMRPPKRICPLGSNQREAGPAGTAAVAGGGPDWMATWPRGDTRCLGTTGPGAA